MKQKLNLANLPTKIERLNRLSLEWETNLYVKRDDQTGSEMSGNKIRKLEYALKEALDNKSDTIITCGGIQSNHCRATVAAATKLGLKAIVLLRVSEKPKIEGNYFLDKLFGAEIRFCTPEEYKSSRNELMKTIADEISENGGKAYIVPEGASYGTGTLGYYECFMEIIAQEKEMGIVFNTIVVAVGSGGTYAGLYLANKYLNMGKRVIGMAVCDNEDYFKNVVFNIAKEALPHIGEEIDIDRCDIEINDRYVGIGYALSRPEELAFIADVARKEALVLDPVYTGKAMYGLYNELKQTTIPKKGNILFIHTGGLFGLFPKQEQFGF
ncbi:MAG: D-cysteine desulfhydrase family protein [Bacteroidales bacterium]|jgi:D-cysteine desulfhydrase